MSHVIPYDGKSDPKAFIMRFEAAIQSVEGNRTTMAKSLLMVVTGIARTWYTTLEPGRMFSWDQLKNVLLENFQGNYKRPCDHRSLVLSEARG